MMDQRDLELGLEIIRRAIAAIPDWYERTMAEMALAELEEWYERAIAVLEKDK